MECIYILIDLVLLVIACVLVGLIIYIWRKKSNFHIGSVSEFRNEKIYEDSYKERKKLAHIEEMVEKEYEPEESKDFIDEILFTEGYGKEEIDEN